jgi:hypothetical protein
MATATTGGGGAREDGEGDNQRREKGGKAGSIREENAYVCGRCGSSFDTPQSLRDHEEGHVEEGDEEVEEECCRVQILERQCTFHHTRR